MNYSRSSVNVLNKIESSKFPEYSFSSITLKKFYGGVFRTTPAGIYLLQLIEFLDTRDTRTRCGICSKLIIKTPEQRHCRRSGFFTVNFEHISPLVLVFLLLPFQHVIAGWAVKY